MRLDLETEIRYRDGTRAGVLRNVALDEQGSTTSVVMATGDLVSRSVIVPIELLEEGAGGVLTLALASEDVEGLLDYEEELVPAISGEWQFNENAAPGGDVFPATIYEPNMPVVEVNNLPEGQISIGQGTEVACLDGRWGVVDEVVVDDAGNTSAIVVRADNIGEADRIVPVTLIQQVDAAQVLLNCTTADLPTYTEAMRNEHEEPEAN